uniref:Uncharacterized protein n=1 Tax=Globisporangium ultimum (strain ATCC 200006 / CBS 805.95 / DAOM BR144) TaxID=431595 RepID=K3X375_GLOUD
MDPMRALDMQFRTGISHDEVDGFATRMDMIAKAMEEIKNGTFDPNTCKIPGYKTPEQEEAERIEHERLERERARREHERKQQQKRDESENWWMKAKLRFSVDDDDDAGEDCDNNAANKASGSSEKVQFAANRALAAYKERDANDYSLWNNWEPQDPVTQEERAEKEAQLEKQRNAEFESNNPEFCNQFKMDLETRQKTQKEKERIADKLKQQGNQLYKRKQYASALQQYMKALEKCPFNVAVLTNIAQCYLRLEEYDDSVEFSSRALFVDPDHIKALSRRAAVWHIQKKWHEAAQDMEKAIQLDPDNEDLVEQHSIIVGDYEDSIAHSKFHAIIANTSRSNKNSNEVELNNVDELRFVIELLKRMDEKIGTPPEEENNTKSQVCRAIETSWVTYELLLPFVEANENVQTLIRTSNELHKLCERLSTAFGTLENNSRVLTDGNDQELIVNAMLRCTAAAIANSPRNQIVVFRHQSFRQLLLGRLETTISSTLTESSLPWSMQASLLRFFEEAVDCKSWRKAILTSRKRIETLLRLLPLPLQAPDHNAKQNLVLSASSICLTISGDSQGVKELVEHHSVMCLASAASALNQYRDLDMRALTNILGVLTNMSTNKKFRACLEEEKDSCVDLRTNLVANLLGISTGSYLTGSTPLSLCAAERALAILLNLSFHDASRLRREGLMQCDVVTHVERILKTMTPETLNSKLLLYSRAVSLLCRLHTVLGTTTKSPADNQSALVASKRIETEKKLQDAKLLDLLYQICQQAFIAAAVSTTTTDSVLPSEETWQLCAQIWCHVGWCIHAPAVRAYLREKHSLHAMLQTIKLANRQFVSYPQVGSDARERVVGNIIKVLITMHDDQDPHDLKLLSAKSSLKALVDALQMLPDGLARKNVAILLAKLCRADPHVKDQVRALRGIEMMLSVSQSLAKVPQSKSRIAQTPGPAF